MSSGAMNPAPNYAPRLPGLPGPYLVTPNCASIQAYSKD
jgi:hypothetical protein